jgi:predicted transcriptional regulator
MDERHEPEAAQRANGKTPIIEVVTKLQETCGKCKPITAITCLTSCNVWKLKSQLRKTHEIMRKPDHMRSLLNALKNGRRLMILKVTTEERLGIRGLQDKLRREGYNHSQETVTREYMIPMLDAGLIEETHDHYHATILGRGISELTKNVRDFGKLFPPHSECYEETILDALLENSKTFKGFEELVPPKSVARVLKRLGDVGLVETKEENDYIFYFKTKRNPQESELSPTEEKIYGRVSDEGIPVRRIATTVGISLRRTYKYLRKLRGKKLVFTRRIPKVYKLTDRGVKVAVTLKKMHSLTTEMLEATTRFLENEKIGLQARPEQRQSIPLAPIRIEESD